MADRIIALIDMDCFYVQVEQKQEPKFLNSPCAVVQYNRWKGGGIIAVSYEARKFGVKNGMRGHEAKLKCPNIHLFQVPESRGKANLTRYRDASMEVMEVLSEFGDCMERASIDEAFLDLTNVAATRAENQRITEDLLPSTYVVEYDSDKTDQIEENLNSSSGLDARSVSLKRWLDSASGNTADMQLAAAAVIVEEIRAAVLQRTGFKCSAGISHNKTLAKLACGLHKPNNQTILPRETVAQLFQEIPVNKVRSLGGKLGDEIKEKLLIETMGQLADIPLPKLHSIFGEKIGLYLSEISHGIDYDPVISRQLAKSIGCGKNFRGKLALATETQILYWLGQLSEELEERLQKDEHNNQRRATLLTVSFSRGSVGATSRSSPLYIYDAVKMARDAYSLIQKSENHPHPISHLALSAGKFQDSIETIKSFFNVTPKALSIQSEEKAEVSSISLTTVEQKAIKSKFLEQSQNKNKSILGFFAKRLKEKKEMAEMCSHSAISAKVESGDINDVAGASEDCLNLRDEMELEEIDETVLPHLPHDIRKEIESCMGMKSPDETSLKSLEKNCIALKPNFQLHFETVTEPSSEAASTSEKCDDSSYKCEKCNRSILASQVDEHADFHFAQELQSQIRMEERCHATCPQSISRTSSHGKKSNSKRKGRPKKEGPAKCGKMRKLESYFG